jgi:hypothetical protein
MLMELTTQIEGHPSAPSVTLRPHGAGLLPTSGRRSSGGSMNTRRRSREPVAVAAGEAMINLSIGQSVFSRWWPSPSIAAAVGFTAALSIPQAV